jgi:hypothetical protein
VFAQLSFLPFAEETSILRNCFALEAGIGEKELWGIFEVLHSELLTPDS